MAHANLLSNLDLVKACDNFPYDSHSTDLSLYQLYLPHDDRPYGFLLSSTVQRMPWTSDFIIDHDNLTVTLQDRSNGVDTSGTCNAAFAAVIDAAIEQNDFVSLHGKHSEPFPILGARYPVRIERFAGDLFGIVARGAHLTVYTRSADDGGLRIWVPRRSKHMFTYPNKLDTTVAGGVRANETPFKNIIAEADEEASLPPELLKRDARAGGVLTYIEYSSEAAAGEERLVMPNVIYVYDLEVSRDLVPAPKDGEVQDFYLMGVEEIQEALAKGEFKTNSAVVMIDFFVRHGLIDEESERDYVEIVTRMHRRLPFPTSVEGRV